MMTGAMMTIMYFIAPRYHFHYQDLCKFAYIFNSVVFFELFCPATLDVQFGRRLILFWFSVVVPFMLIVYGAVCIPQAYLFSLGPRVALNAMSYLIVNLILGEAMNSKFYNQLMNVFYLSYVLLFRRNNSNCKNFLWRYVFICSSIHEFVSAVQYGICYSQDQTNISL